ncbi:MAG TPA: molybdate ABC transporter substrate-binding protein [Thermoanaerobaculia bacterium]|nr:molybdate ABC transporter substrate-binding protein [Thermoanaerobaculia bacterium]
MKLALVLVSLLLAAPSRGAEVHVAAAASLTDALKEIAAAYERDAGDKVVFNFGASSLLARQIEEGFPADLFLSADEEKMDLLEKQGLIDRSTRRRLLSNSLVVVVPEGSEATLLSMKDLAAPRFRTIAVAETRTVPAGIYARRALEKVGVFSAVESRLVPTENVRGALAAVESGNADAGIVYKTDALAAKHVRVAFSLPAAEGPDISYPVAVLRSSPHPEAARRFLAALSSEGSRRVFTRLGFVVRPEGR